LKAPAAESASPAPSKSADGAGWRYPSDAARGTRGLRLDSAGRPETWVDAGGNRLDFTHAEDGSLCRMASDDWFADIAGPRRGSTFSVRDRAGETSLLLTRGGRVRTLRRGGDRLSIELDVLQRVRRVRLPGSAEALDYDWDEEGGCVVRSEGGEILVRLSEAGIARRLALDETTWWDETVTPARVRLEAVLDGAPHDGLDLRLEGLAAIAERRWRDGSGDRFERDSRGRLQRWVATGADGVEIERRWTYEGNDLVEDEAGRRTLAAGGRVLRLDRPDGEAVDYAYDASGRRIARREGGLETTYRYDPLGSLTAVERSGERNGFETDGFGRRVASTGSDRAPRREHRDEAGRLWAVTDAAGRALHCYIWLGDRIIARIDGAIGRPVAEAYLCDPLGTPNAAFVAERGGWRFERLDSPPYGRADDPLRPTLYGHFADPETGLIHMGARELDPQLGLFLTPDPWHGGEDDPRRLAGAPDSLLQGEQERPAEGFHDYALCRFDPLGRCDRDGHVSAGEVFLHILRWILLPTWGFPLTAISLFFFQPFNLYMEIIGLIVWGFKQLCEDKSHPWGNHTLAKATWLLGSLRQFTFAFGLNGFLPRVISGGGLSGDRAVTVGNVIWISSEELDFLGRPETVDVEDIAGGGAGTKFNDDPAKDSVVALLAADGDGKQKIHVSHWTRGFGNAVAARGGHDGFVDAPTGGASLGTLHLRRPVPYDVPVPRASGDHEHLEVREFIHSGGATATLETVSSVWFGLKVPKDSGYAVGDWLRISAPNASAPIPDAAFRRIREKLPASDHAALILSEELPARFQTARLSAGLKLEAASPAGGARASAGWTVGGSPTTLVRALAAGPVPADFPPDLSADSMVRIVAAAPAAAARIAGLPAGPAEDTRFVGVKAIRTRLTLAPDAGGASAGHAVRRVARRGAVFHGIVEHVADRSNIKLAAPHPDIAANDLLIVTQGAAEPVFVRATAAPAGEVLTVDPALPAAIAAADGAGVDLQRAAANDGDTATATIASVAGAGADVSVPTAGYLAAGNLVRIEIFGVPVLRKVEAVTGQEIDVADAPVGTGNLTLTRVAVAADRVRTGVELAPPGRFLKWTGGTPLGNFGDWPDKVLAIEQGSFGFINTVNRDTAAFYVKWGGARPAAFHDEFHRTWTIATEGADQFVVLETPLPIVRHKDGGTYWRSDPDDHSGYPDLPLDPFPSPFIVRAVEYIGSGAVRADRAGRARVLAGESEVLIPDDSRAHHSHRRALIEHEIHHTVQCNFWGPLMTALPLPGLAMTAVDIVAGAGGEIPPWLHQVERDAHGHPPQNAEGRIPDNTELNPFQVASMGGLMQLAWKYVFLLPFRPIGDLNDKIEALDFEDFNQVFNPLSRLITQNLPQVDPHAAPGDVFLQVLGQMLSKALDLRSWTPFLGFVPTLLPDGPTNFIEQGASRASGDLYSTILTANDRFNLRTRGRLFGHHEDVSANIRSGLGRPIRLLVFCGHRTDRVFRSGASDAPGVTTAYRETYRENEPFTITLPAGRAKALFPAALYEVRPGGGGPAPAPVMIEGPPPTHSPTPFVEANPGDTVIPLLRALVPLPPRVNGSLGFYLVAAAPGALTVKTLVPETVDAEIAIGGTIAAGNSVTAVATSPTLTGSPISIGPVAAAAGQGASQVAAALAAAIGANAVLAAAGITADNEGGKVLIKIRRAQEPLVEWTVQRTGGLTAGVSSGKARKEDPGTETVTVTIVEEVKLGEELVPWAAPAAVGALPAAAAGLHRFQTEENDLKFRGPDAPNGGALADVGNADLVLEFSDATVVKTPLTGNVGWKVTMPVAVPAAPVRLRLFRPVRKNDPGFDLEFRDVPSLVGRRSYLDVDTFVVVRDLMLTVDPLPEIPPAAQAWDQPFELTLPIRLVGGARSIVITPPAGVAAPPVTRIGDQGRGEKWRIGPLAEPPGEDALFRVVVTYGRPGASVDKPFELRFRPSIGITAAAYDLLAGTPLELTVTGGTPPYTVSTEPVLAGLVVTQPAPDKVRLESRAAPEAATELSVSIADSASPAAHGLRRISVKAMPPILLPNDTADYFDDVRPVTFGLARPLINGRSSGGAGANVDLTEPLDAMETVVKATAAGDSIYLSAWFFEPATVLTGGGLGAITTWGGLLARKAEDGVKIRILINDFDPISHLDHWLNTQGLAPLDAIIAALPAAKRDNLKYLVSMHPASVGPLKAALAGQGFRDIHVASHHQKFMVVRRGAELTAFCGGLDIESRKTPALWSDAGLAGWHDIQVQLEGPITRDLEHAFIARWNRERTGSTRPARPGWAAMEALAPTPLSPAENAPARKPHVIQMLRTVSDNAAASPYQTRRDDIKQVYRRAIAGARQFLYLENQYFRSTELADWIAAAGRAQPALKVIMVVVGNAAADDGANALTEHGNHLQFETFDRIARALGPRAAFYTMKNRAVHSKFMLADDSWMTIGSANGNVRSFELDSELNVQIADPALARAFRARLWAHNLGAAEATVSGWGVGDFIPQWNAVAAANATRAVAAMDGEGVIAFDYTVAPGTRHGSIPDALVNLDFGTDGGRRAADESDRIA
jgi:YD repeat-containing protein